jgi:hypothetical protein
MLITRTACCRFTVIVALVLVTLKTAPAFAQTATTPTDPDRGKISLAAGTDFANTYMFRGFRQDDTKVITWPYGDLGLGVYSGDGGLKRVSIHAGTWNSLHPGDAGRNGPSGKLWYERNFYSALSLGFGGGVNLGTSYTAYLSPNKMFSTVKEIALKVAVDDRASLGAIKPYALLAFELKTAPGLGQVDGGAKAGRYFEVGAGPGWARKAMSISFPVKVGLSLGNYYELAGADHRFGYVSAGSMVTVPLGGKSRLGAWSVRGGVEFQSLGKTTRARNNGDRSEVIGSFGFGVSR